VVPIRPTNAPAVGPPRIVAAIKVEVETENIAPRGILIGMAEANRVTADQNATPPSGAYCPNAAKGRAIGSSAVMGNRRVVATSASALVATTPVM